MKITSRTFWSLLGLAIVISCKQKNNYNTASDGKSLLWEVTGNGLDKPSYFLGTMHMMCAEDAVLSRNVQKIIKSSGVIYLEVDMDNAAELLSGMDIGMKDGVTLESLLNDEEYRKVRAFFEAYQPAVPFAILEKQHPIMLSSTLYEFFLQCDKKNGIDLKIIDEAYKAKKKTKGLETIAFQAGIFDSIPYSQQAADLVKTIDSLDRYKQVIEEMVKVYQSQDVEKLYKLTEDEDSGTAGYLDILLYKRNANWVDQFPAIAKKRSTLFAVGAGHLGGTKGVLSLLKQKGYNIRPLENR